MTRCNRDNDVFFPRMVTGRWNQLYQQIVDACSINIFYYSLIELEKQRGFSIDLR